MYCEINKIKKKCLGETVCRSLFYNEGAGCMNKSKFWVHISRSTGVFQ